MKIHCLCLIKNEADILEECINSALGWADTIVIADNGSSDGTLEVIAKLAENPKIITLQGFNVPFRDNLRAKMFHQVKHIAHKGDWWCRLDADEIYIDEPRSFLADLPQYIDTVWSSHFNYRFTGHDLDRYLADPEKFSSIPVTGRLRHYLNDGSEPRFVRVRFPYVWNWAWPTYRFFSASQRIKLRQYQYRSPEQITSRIKTRVAVFQQSGGVLFPHEVVRGLTADHDFMQRVVPTDGLDLDDGGPLHERPEHLPRIYPLKPAGVPKLVWISWVLIQVVWHHVSSRLATKKAT